MYDFLEQKSEYPYKGKHYFNAPTIPMTEAGTPFRYAKPSQGSDEKANVVANLEYRREQLTITTTARLLWEPESYVVLGDELWRIVLISKRYLDSPQGAMIRKPPVEYTLTLDRCDNPVGVSFK
jgi:hypothetical protein